MPETHPAPADTVYAYDLPDFDAEGADAPPPRRPAPEPTPEVRRLTMTYYAAVIGGRPEIDPAVPRHRVPGGFDRTLARRVRRACQAVAGEGTSERVAVATVAAARHLDRARRAVAAML